MLLELRLVVRTLVCAEPLPANALPLSSWTLSATSRPPTLCAYTASLRPSTELVVSRTIT
jgi:hypothetical protein